jgi:ABC-type siderophore export system fused ATPase/permease subunit
LVGITKPTGGEIWFNDKRIDNETYAAYRNRIAVVFSDNHLFTENYENVSISEENQELLSYIEFMKLTGIIKINREKNKLEVELSKGQQKRLCMIYALLENKDVLVLDEWAADQDPVFRAYFYYEFLPVLKALGKTIIMVTHDDLYYKCTDRIIKFDYGQIVSDKRIGESVPQIEIK